MRLEIDKAARKRPVVERHTRRLLSLGLGFAAVLHFAAFFSVWGDWPKVEILAVEFFIISIFNAWVSKRLTTKLGFERAEAVRILPNTAAILLIGSLINWGLLFWLWLPYSVVLNNDLQMTRANWRVPFLLISISVFAVASGASLLEALCFVGLSIYWHLLNAEHIHFGQSMIDEREENLLEVAFAHDELSQRKEQLDKANSDLGQHISELHRTQRQLIEASRKAGMADVATSVLHNVGNVLNSVNVSANLVTDLVRTSKTAGLHKALHLLDSQPDPGRFLSEDPKGKKLIEYIGEIAKNLSEEQKKMLGELDSLNKNVDHIKIIVSMQQQHAKAGGVIEPLSISEIVDDSIKTNEASYQKHEIEIVREYAALPLIESDRHKLFQIMMNLLSNAKQAVDGLRYTRRITARIKDEGEQAAIEIEDNGRGIPPENIEKIFSHGFTTKTGGHGFGLHSSANAAKELGGALTVASAGPGQGAKFTLRIPQKQMARSKAA